MKNIVLIGFMGTGKTAVAKEVSKKFGMKYISTDDIIEEIEKIKISNIFSEKGEDYFRKVEKRVIKDISEMENVVVDAGGGVSIDPENIENLKKKGTIVCLFAAPEVILERTKKNADRPLLNVSDPLAKIKELLEKRKPFYKRADHHISTSKMSLEGVVGEIERIIKDAKEDR